MQNLAYLLLSFLPRAFAQTIPPADTTITLPNPIACADFSACADTIINAILAVAIPIVAIMVLVGGFQMMTAAGDPEKFGKGRKTILYASVGFAIVLLSKAVVLIIQDILTP